MLLDGIQEARLVFHLDSCSLGTYGSWLHNRPNQARVPNFSLFNVSIGLRDLPSLLQVLLTLLHSPFLALKYLLRLWTSVWVCVCVCQPMLSWRAGWCPATECSNASWIRTYQDSDYILLIQAVNQFSIGCFFRRLLLHSKNPPTYLLLRLHFRFIQMSWKF